MGMRLGVRSVLVPGVGAVTMTLVGPDINTRTWCGLGSRASSSAAGAACWGSMARCIGVLRLSSKRSPSLLARGPGIELSVESRARGLLTATGVLKASRASDARTVLRLVKNENT